MFSKELPYTSIIHAWKERNKSTEAYYSLPKTST